jgi:hypothetical protein
MDSVVVALPLGKNVNYKAYANAGWQQQALLTCDDGRKFLLTGTGEGNVPVGSTGSFVTPGTWTSDTFDVQVTVQHRKSDKDAWAASDVQVSTDTTWGVSTATVVSEDGAPGFEPDWNDFVVQIVWFL